MATYRMVDDGLNLVITLDSKITANIEKIHLTF